jgi:tRNA A37 threonylcarbamoyladenosine modification protein TsaB
MGLAAARALGLALDVKVAGVSTLDALASGAPGALPVIDARRREVFTLIDGEPAAIGPEGLGNSLLQGRICVGDGAVRYREVLEAAGAEIPPDESELHVPRASLHAGLARDFGPAELVEPIYVRAPDADKVLKR